MPHTVNFTVKTWSVWLHSGIVSVLYNLMEKTGTQERTEQEEPRLPQALCFPLSHVTLSLPLCHPVLASLPNPASNHPTLSLFSWHTTWGWKLRDTQIDRPRLQRKSSNALHLFLHLGHPCLFIACCFGCWPVRVLWLDSVLHHCFSTWS